MYRNAWNNLPVRDDGILPVHLVPQGQLLFLLDAVDMTAARRVQEDEPAPGPFGAATYVYHTGTGQARLIGDMDSNRVNRDGPSAHAEGVNLYPDRFAALKQFLRDNKNDPAWVVLFVTTGESCPTCFTKQTIAIDHLRTEGLINEGRVLNVYGASYAYTKAVAGFSDEDQLLDMQNYPNGGGVANFSSSGMENLPEDARKILMEPGINNVAFIVENGEVLQWSLDLRGDTSDIFATPEVSVIQKLCKKRIVKGLSEPWKLNNATMFSTTDISRAPLARAVGYWASIPRFIRVTGEGMEGRQTREAPVLTNDELFKAVVTRPYNTIGLIKVFQCVGDGGTGNSFGNQAQHAWGPRKEADAARGRQIHYDGGQPGRAHGPGCGC